MVVGIGLEGKVVCDLWMLINVEGDGVVDYVDVNEIVICYDCIDEEKFVFFEDNCKIYKLIKFLCIN